MPEPVRPPSETWIEPTSSLPLHWGGYRTRWIAGIACILLGTVAVQFTSAYSLQFLLFGSLTQAVGWIVLPAATWRRVVVVLPAVAATWLLLGGTWFFGFFTVPLAAWLLVRHRPALSYLVVALPLVAGIVLAGVSVDYNDGWVARSLGGALVVVCAWIGRTLATVSAARRSARPPEEIVSRSSGDLH